MCTYLKTENFEFLLIVLVAFFSSVLACGQSVIQPTFGARIVNGEEAKPNSWPWMVYLEGKNRCGGSILDKDTILTAAHCVEMISNPSNLKIIVGLHNKSEVPLNSIYSASKIFIHPQYNNAIFRYDVAIIKLKKSLIFSDHVSSVCLPSADSHEFVYGKDVVTTGWGITETGKSATLLQQAKLKVANETFFAFIRSKVSSYFVPTEQYAVIEDDPQNNPDTNVCIGDSGGPLVYFDGRKWTIYGITSYGKVDDLDKCLTFIHTFFESVPFYTGFIDKISNSTKLSVTDLGLTLSTKTIAQSSSTNLKQKLCFIIFSFISILISV
jgi:secreted trypsin-like serine protease